MFITWRNFNATTGPVEYRFDNQCGRCVCSALDRDRLVPYRERNPPEP